MLRSYKVVKTIHYTALYLRFFFCDKHRIIFDSLISQVILWNLLDVDLINLFGQHGKKLRISCQSGQSINSLKIVNI